MAARTNRLAKQRKADEARLLPSPLPLPPPVFAHPCPGPYTGPCRQCAGPAGMLVCYAEPDKAKLSIMDNTGRTPVHMCSKCDIRPKNRVCEHCVAQGRKPGKELFDWMAPLDQRPPCWIFDDGRKPEFVAAACIGDVEESIADGPQCNQCNGYWWQGKNSSILTFAYDRIDGEHWCDECMKEQDMHQCEGKHCERVCDKYELRHGRCYPCRKHLDFSDSDDDDDDDDEDDDDDDRSAKLDVQ